MAWELQRDPFLLMSDWRLNICQGIIMEQCPNNFLVNDYLSLGIDKGADKLVTACSMIANTASKVYDVYSSLKSISQH